MRSLTGFGRGTATTSTGRTLTAFISAVNHKGVQVSLKAGLADPAVEDELRTLVRTRVGRGAVTVQLSEDRDATAGVDLTAVAAAWLRLAELARSIGAPAPTLDTAARLVDGTAQAIEVEVARAALDAALIAFDAARQREGAAIERSLRADAAELRRIHAAVVDLARERVTAWRSGLVARLREALAELGATGDEAALVRECAIYAERIDLSEELQRLATHLDALDRLLGRDPIGKELDFLAQEIARELSTTGAKANDATIAAQVIAGKLAVDRIREQSANLM